MDIRKVPASQGLSWWMDSWNLVRAHLLFTLAMSAFFLVAEFFGFLPNFGITLGGIITVILSVGSMKVFAAWDHGEKIGFSAFFCALMDAALFRRLLKLFLFIVFMGILMDGTLYLERLAAGNLQTQSLHFNPTSIAFYFFFLIVYAVYLMALQFFVPLIFFKNISLGEAAELSVKACTHNWAALALNLLGLVGLLGIAALTMGLAIVIVMPMMMALPYIMYKNLFV